MAQADARADHATLAAVGADPRLRRSLAAPQALVIAGIGTALGVAVGFFPALALIGPSTFAPASASRSSNLGDLVHTLILRTSLPGTELK